jgi:hypothetical protein
MSAFAIITSDSGSLYGLRGGLGDHQRISDDDLGQVEDIDFVWPRIDYTLFSHREGPWT